MVTLTQAPLTVEQLQRAAVWARDSFEIHFERCRSRHKGFCQKCDDLDVAAYGAERVYLEARNGN